MSIPLADKPSAANLEKWLERGKELARKERELAERGERGRDSANAAPDGGVKKSRRSLDIGADIVGLFIRGET